MLNPYLNIAEVKVQGIDFETQYVARPEWITERPQTLAVRAFASRLLKRSNIPTPGAPEVRLDGGFDQNTVNGPTLYPRWKGNLSLAYTVGPGPRSSRRNGSASARINVTWVEGVDVDDNWLPNYFNTNLKLAWAGDGFMARTALGSRAVRHQPVRPATR